MRHTLWLAGTLVGLVLLAANGGNCAGVQYKSVAGQKGWTAELAIPLASLNLAAPTKENPWRVNFCRNHFYTEGSPVLQLERSSWRPTFGSFHNVDRFGILFFGPEGP